MRSRSSARAVLTAGIGGLTNPDAVRQYAHGRYELRGDGVSVPYAWVWIPNAVPAAAAPAGPNQDGPEGSGPKTP